MTLLDFINTMEKVASEQPSVNMIVRDSVYKLNEAPVCKYGAFCWTQQAHKANEDYYTLSFWLFYVDRLTADKGNQTEVQSVGCETLSNIIRTLAQEFDCKEWQLNTFPAERFKDDCSGAYATASFVVPVTQPCPEIYEGKDILTI